MRKRIDNSVAGKWEWAAIAVWGLIRPHTATGLGTGSCTPGVSGVFRVTSVTGALDER